MSEVKAFQEWQLGKMVNCVSFSVRLIKYSTQIAAGNRFMTREDLGFSNAATGSLSFSEIFNSQDRKIPTFIKQCASVVTEDLNSDETF